MSKLRNIFQLGVALFLLSLPGLAYSHAVVTDTSLETEPVAPYQATRVRLTFNSNVELGLSKIFLVSKGDKEQLLKAIKSHSQGKVIIDLPALDPGEYALKFQVFAADGHLTEDVIRFQVEQ